MTGKYLGTIIRHQSDDIETLYIEPSWHDERVKIQSVAIAPLKHDETSVVFLKFKDIVNGINVMQFVFTEEETDMIIEALVEAKKRWGTGRVIG
jgi:hypothetical protein